MGLIHFKGLDGRTYVLSDCESNEVRANAYKDEQKNRYEFIYQTHRVKVSRSEFFRVLSMQDTKT